MSIWPGAVVAAAISWPATMLARRELAERGRTGFDGWSAGAWRPRPRWVRHLGAPYFLRVTPSGADLLGTGEVPWDAITFVSVASHTRTRWFGLYSTSRSGTLPDEAARTAQRGDELEAMLRLSGWPAEQVTAAARRTGDVEVHAFLA